MAIVPPCPETLVPCAPGEPIEELDREPAIGDLARLDSGIGAAKAKWPAALREVLGK